MKRTLILIIAVLLLQSICFAEQMNVSFVYINGSNNNNQKMKNWYENGVKKLHPMLKKKFETNKDTKSWYDKEQGMYYINPEPVIFFWGDESQAELDWLKNQIKYAKTVSPTIAYRVRGILASYLHDAIWIQKTHNMLPVLDNLNKVVQSEYEKGNKVSLYGYSAGTFITYEYLINKLPYINLQDLFQVMRLNNETQNFIKTNPQNNTCISALEDAKIGVVSDTGHLILDDSANFKANYLKLNESTKRVCSPKGALASVVNFASPLALFYSDLSDPTYEMNYYKALMIKYVIDNGIVFLTVNFREDPMGFATTKNLTLDELEQVTHVNFTNPSGLFYDNSKVWSKRSVINAHTSYWDANKIFSDAIVKTLADGMKFNYDEKYQQKMLKKRDENFDIW